MPVQMHSLALPCCTIHKIPKLPFHPRRFPRYDLHPRKEKTVEAERADDYSSIARQAAVVNLLRAPGISVIGYPQLTFARAHAILPGHSLESVTSRVLIALLQQRVLFFSPFPSSHQFSARGRRQPPPCCGVTCDLSFLAPLPCLSFPSLSPSLYHRSVRARCVPFARAR